MLVVQILLFEVGHRDGRRKRQGSTWEEERAGVKREGGQGRGGKHLFNHIDYFNLHPTQSLKKQEIENPMVQTLPCALLFSSRELFPTLSAKLLVFVTMFP